MIHAVLFDFDGTLTAPGPLDFGAIREALGCPGDSPILEYIGGLRPKARTRAIELLDKFEYEASRRSHPNEGAEDLLRFLIARKIRLGIISRNSLRSIRRSLRNFSRVRPSDFEVILTRDDTLLPKPSPQGIWAAAAALSLPVDELLVVGDFIFDIEAGQKAGAQTAYLTNGSPERPLSSRPDFTISRLAELKTIVDRATIAGP